jgi:predicted dehydrogenase
MEQKKITRRYFFMGTAALVAAGCTTTSKRPRPRRISANEKINFAGVGCGGKGQSDIQAMAQDNNIVALCDVDDTRGAETFGRFPNAKRYRDYREMLEKEFNNIDAMNVSTPDHMHAPIALMAMRMGKHVYVQKPLTHSIEEARLMRKVAKEYKVATQMGNQGHSGEGVRKLCEMIWSGAIGQIREAHIWTNRPVWPQGYDRPEGSDPVPPTLDWNVWLGGAPERPFKAIHPAHGGRCYLPHEWRGWWDFGCGALGDMACHIADPANWALKLSTISPTAVEVVHQEGETKEQGPKKSHLKFSFPARGEMVPVEVHWYDGGLKPEKPSSINNCVMGDKDNNGSVYIGDKGVATAGEYGGNPRLLPDPLMLDYKFPDPTIPRSKSGHYGDWFDAIRGGKQSSANFEYSGPFTEWVLLGNLALRTGKSLQWDADNLHVTNAPEANQWVKKEYRKGFGIHA